MANVIGIDLGTTNTVVAVIRDGRAQVVPTQEGDLLIPSIVCSDRDDSELLYVGMPAKAYMKVAQDAVYSTKRLMGMLYFDEAEGPPAKLIEDYEQFVRVKNELAYPLYPDPEGKDQLVRVKVGGRFRKPEDVAELILRKAKFDAEMFTGAPVTGAVITTPAYFESKQKAATARAAQQAGLEVLDLMDEPNAAAMAAGYRPTDGRARWVLVFDLGGGTFDVSLLQISSDRRFNVYAKGGNNWLGGDDMDNCLIRFVEGHARRVAGLAANEVLELRRSLVKPAVEEAKIALSTQDRVVLNIPTCALARPAHGGQPRTVSVSGLEITREEFEKMTRSIVDQTLAVVDDVLKSSPMLRGLIDEVLLIGGSTYVPAVRRAISEQFPGKVRAIDEINPMHQVALGAAINADSIQRQKDEGAERPDQQVIDVTERGLGIECVDARKRSVYEILIPKGTPLKKAESEYRTFRATRPDALTIPVYVGEHAEAARNRCQGIIRVNIDPPVDLGHPIHIKLHFTADRLIHVYTRIDGRSEVLHDFEYAIGPEDDEDWQMHLEQSLAAARHFLSEYSDYVDESEKRDLNKLLERGEQALDTRAQIEAVTVSKRIKRVIFYTEQIGNQLFQVNQLISSPSLSQAKRTQLQELANTGKELYHECQEHPTSENQMKLKQLVTVFETFLGMAFREVASSSPGQAPGFVEKV